MASPKLPTLAARSSSDQTTMTVKNPQKRLPSPTALVSQSETPLAGLVTVAQLVTEEKGPRGWPAAAGHGKFSDHVSTLLVVLGLEKMAMRESRPSMSPGHCPLQTVGLGFGYRRFFGPSICMVRAVSARIAAERLLAMTDVFRKRSWPPPVALSLVARVTMPVTFRN